MAAMQRLRQARFLARLVLAWFALAIGVAVASPVVQPKSTELVCSGGTMKLMVHGEADEPATSHAPDCPLCATTAAPPPVSIALEKPSPLAHAVEPVAAARLAARIGAPLPARGPPSLS
ncbi:hypothetical protein EZ313_09880 [Ramlibacter henchirensis]|uniref:DUF2946 domain-containing protein n=2 Tax=Ramlibacter henchirensis TaxID=204072 RepID=A0A4Z0C5M4_9BURK|nr:hypothetical protein EZ313_09880 [Ramlibacter henchirensis]